MRYECVVVTLEKRYNYLSGRHHSVKANIKTMKQGESHVNGFLWPPGCNSLQVLQIVKFFVPFDMLLDEGTTTWDPKTAFEKCFQQWMNNVTSDRAYFEWAWEFNLTDKLTFIEVGYFFDQISCTGQRLFFLSLQLHFFIGTASYNIHYLIKSL